MKNYKIAIIDYGMGNLFSIASACQKVGLNPLISREKKLIMECSAIILPGVGAYNEAMKRLNKLHLIDTINEFIISGKKLFGICLGMQLLFSSSSEFIETQGLDIIKGKVKKLDSLTNNPSLKIPYIGWNKIIQKDIEHNEMYVYETKNEIIGCIVISETKDQEYKSVKWLKNNKSTNE